MFFCFFVLLIYLFPCCGGSSSSRSPANGREAAVCNGLWQVIQTHNIRIRSSQWSSQLKKPPQAKCTKTSCSCSRVQSAKNKSVIPWWKKKKIPGNFGWNLSVASGQIVSAAPQIFSFITNISIFLFPQQFCFPPLCCRWWSCLFCSLAEMQMNRSAHCKFAFQRIPLLLSCSILFKYWSPWVKKKCNKTLLS